MARVHIIKAGMIVNTILATMEEAQAVFPDDELVDGDAHPGAIGDSWTGSAVVPAPAPPPAVPISVAMWQARNALLDAGITESTINTMIAALPEPQRTKARNKWEYSGTVRRDDDLVLQLAPALGLTEAQVDSLFIAANQL